MATFWIVFTTGGIGPALTVHDWTLSKKFNSIVLISRSTECAYVKKRGKKKQKHVLTGQCAVLIFLAQTRDDVTSVSFFSVCTHDSWVHVYLCCVLFAVCWYALCVLRFVCLHISFCLPDCFICFHFLYSRPTRLFLPSFMRPWG